MKMRSSAVKGSFHEAIGPVLWISQFFGILPANGVCSKDISNISFRWTSLKTVYSLLFLICGWIECLLSLRLLVTRGISISQASSSSFLLTSIVGACSLFGIAQNWNMLMKFWYDSEKVFLEAPYKVCGWPLKRKIQLWAATIGILSLGNQIDFAFMPTNN